MKKFFILLIPVLTACSIQAFSQNRTIDVETTMLSPVTNDVINPGQSFSIAFQIKNLGPDTLTQNDTIALSLSFNGSAILFGNPPVSYIDISAPYLEPGDSTQSSFQFSISNSWPTGPTTICVKMMPKNAADSIDDNDTLNNESCNTVSIEYPSSVSGLSKTIGDVSLYPNPVNGVAHFDITLNRTTDVQVIVTDITGREVLREQRINLSGSQKIDINTSSLSSGTYLYKVNTGDDVQTGKMIVQ